MAGGITRRIASAVLLAAMVVGAGGCAGEADVGDREVVVLAASSLTDPFNAIKDEFVRHHPQFSVEIGFGSSSALAAQITNGASADVFASADRANMAKVDTEGLVSGSVEVFARNTMAIVVPAGNPAGVQGLQDLTRPGLRIALGAPPVPIGRAAREGFGKAGLQVPAASEETDVKAIVNRVALGEADAGVVWVTDIRATKQGVQGVAIPESVNVVSEYPIARLTSGQSDGATAFVTFVRSETGQEILQRYGFRIRA